MIHFGGVLIRKALKNTFLFQNIGEAEADGLISELSLEKIHYDRTDTIFSPERFENKIGFVLNGSLEVRHHGRNGKVVLNILNEGDSFGVLAVFNDSSFPTEIYVKKTSDVLFINKDELICLIRKSSEVALNVIRFLSNRIEFLNNRIENVTKVSVDKKLGSYLLSRVKSEGACELQFNVKKCSESLGAGRASIYRAIESLENKGYIKAENKFIKIIDQISLEEFLK